MVRRSVPASSRCVAKQWRMVWVVTGLARPALPAAGAPWRRTAGGGGGRGARRAGEEPHRRWAGGLPVRAQLLEQRGRQQGVAILLALPLLDPQTLAGAVPNGGPPGGRPPHPPPPRP